MNAGSQVRDNPGQQRYELRTDAGIAVVEYHRDGETLIIFYTEVPYALRRRGIGKRLVRGALDDMRQRKSRRAARLFVRSSRGIPNIGSCSANSHSGIGRS
jgi:predicted GNAT family acetyltransferase